MSLKIRLARGGTKKRPFYHVVVTDQRSKRDGRFIERLGYYNPAAKGAEHKLVGGNARSPPWNSHGLRVSDGISYQLNRAPKGDGVRLPCTE